MLAAAAGPAFAPMQASFAEDAGMTNKIVLLGDSVFDNRAYVTGGADVLAHLVRQLPIGWSADLLAVDGSVMAGVRQQLDRLPADATHLVVSMGGNDALGVSSVLDAPSRSVADALLKLAEIRE
ncbi:hypothetical protein [Mesorhizobium sp.]|nr:hypothetical protein [Mesorhizobium sp.]